MDQIPPLRMLYGDQYEEHAVWRYCDCTRSLNTTSALVDLIDFAKGRPYIYFLPVAVYHNAQNRLALNFTRIQSTLVVVPVASTWPSPLASGDPFLAFVGE